MAIAGVTTCGAAWAVRSPQSSAFAPSVWRGTPGRRALALTFDDGPTPATLQVLDILERHAAVATFFQVGSNTVRHPGIARECAARGHEIANHSHTHPNFALQTRKFVVGEFEAAQEAIESATGVSPRFLRAPYGVRWFGFAEAQRKLGLQGVMWSVIGRDWRLPAPDIAARILNRAQDGDIICLHDGREAQPDPDATATVDALRVILPALVEKGYHFETLSTFLCPMK
jgi:peptidoglycan/xylan/chitin deacetylase (PgdA/CDA1 family)